jgi:hypothetical protein
MAEIGYSFNGIGLAEAQDRVNEHRTGVPSKGLMALLQRTIGIRRTSKVGVANTGRAAAHVRLRHQGLERTIAAEALAALNVPATNRFVGRLQFGAITPGSIVVTEAGALADIVDDGLGKLYDIGFVGVAANFRGTINYVTGALDVTFGAAFTAPVTIAYRHSDYVDFASANQIVSGPAGALPYTLQLPFGRVVPGSVSLTDGVSTWVDDGKGNMIQANLARGTIDYAAGIVVLNTGPAVAAPLTAASVMQYNPFAALVAAGGGQKLLDIFSQIPELTNGPWAAGVDSETRLGLVGESNVLALATDLVVQWSHYGEEPYRVDEVFSGFPPGGFSNDPNVDQAVAHL